MHNGIRKLIHATKKHENSSITIVVSIFVFNVILKRRLEIMSMVNLVVF